MWYNSYKGVRMNMKTWQGIAVTIGIVVAALIVYNKWVAPKLNV